MALIVPDVGEVTLLELMAPTIFSTFHLHLYKNDYTPIASSVLGNFTEANFPGYGAIDLDAWSAVFTNAEGKAETDETVRVFTCTGSGTPNSIYGYYVTDDDGNLLWAERNALGPVVLDASGKTYSVLCRFTGRSEF